MHERMKKRKIRLLIRHGLSNHTALLVFETAKEGIPAKPGQFMMLRLDGYEPLLPRPMSLLETKGRRISFLVKRKGRGTDQLLHLMPGDTCTALGPFGKSFPEVSPVICVAGGYGVAPFYFLTKTRDPSSLYLIYGAQTKREVHFFPFFEEHLGRAHFYIATEDGSVGYHGTAVALVHKLLEEKRIPQVTLFSCGPHGMIRALEEVAQTFSLPHYASLEARMACGFGVCRGCVVPLKEGWRCLCMEGPVVESKKIQWELL